MASPLTPPLKKAGLVLTDPSSGKVIRPIILQYNPDSMTRSFQIPGAGSEAGGRSEPLRLKGPPVETIKIEAVVDAADQLERPDSHAATVAHGIRPFLSALETILYPSTDDLQRNDTLANLGTLLIAPMEGPLVLFVSSPERVAPVRITELSINEQAFDPRLNPIRATITLGLRVLSVDDLGFKHRGAGLYLAYQAGKEALARANHDIRGDLNYSL
ncbi:MAG: hypothetical protein EA425_06940 [Puniceicoccaceae bacterium]|nr:MAG: hypothetical protein EA425_06940 [Puniceicoccaceae bacterium]